MLTVYAINRCLDRSLNKISIDAFVQSLHQPQSTVGGVAQSVVRYCEASALKKASLNDYKSSKRRGRSSVERDLEAKNRVKERKARAIRMYLDGRGPWSTSVKPDTFNVKAKQHASRESKSPKRRGGKKKIKNFLKR